MNDPVCKPVIHHPGQLGQFYSVAVQVNAAGRAVKGKIEDAIVSPAEQIEIILQLFAGIACQVAKLRFHGL